VQRTYGVEARLLRANVERARVVFRRAAAVVVSVWQVNPHVSPMRRRSNVTTGAIVVEMRAGLVRAQRTVAVKHQRGAHAI